MRKEETVDVIITTYHREYSMLKRAIKSALNQSYSNIKIVVVDDNDEQTRNKLKIEHHIREFSEIAYIKHKNNKGLSAARNTGIKNSKGKYIAFLDDDDEWTSNKIELQLSEFKKNNSNCGLVYSPYFVVYDTNNKKIFKKIPNYKGKNTNHLLEEGNYICYPLIKRECFEKVGLFDTNLFHSEDFEMWLRISTKYDFSCIKEPVAYYHNHGTNSMTYDYESFIKASNYIQQKHSILYANNKKAKHNIVVNRAYAYARAKKIKMSLFTYGQSVIICPKKIFTNLLSLIHLIQIVLCK